MKEISVYLYLLVLLLSGGDLPDGKTRPVADVTFGMVPMCNDWDSVPAGRCTGSVYCSACKNCKYCAHCNSGGSCGVCGKRPSPRPRKTEPEPVRKYYPAEPQKKDRPAASAGVSNSDDSRTTPIVAAKTYVVTQETSLRASGQAQATVLKRLKVGEEVVAIETSGEFWWQVVQQGRTGWVKRHLLKEKVQRIYP
jgi:hypothetical protein